jgi:hypothetical protein
MDFIVVPWKWTVVGICIWGMSDVAVADPFRCQHQAAAPVPVLTCSDSGSSDQPHSAWVTLRKMPAWGTHAGLTIIDLCLKDNDSSGVGKLPVLSVDAPANELKSLLSGNCKRRYCTDKKKAFSFLLNSFPFPVGWTAISFQLGIQTQSFSITCDEFKESTSGFEGEMS